MQWMLRATSAVSVVSKSHSVATPLDAVPVVVVVVVALLRSIRRSLLGPGLWGVSGILLSSSVASRDRLGLSS